MHACTHTQASHLPQWITYRARRALDFSDRGAIEPQSKPRENDSNHGGVSFHDASKSGQNILRGLQPYDIPDLPAEKLDSPEQGLQTYTLTSKSPIQTNPQNLRKAQKILGLTDTRTRFSFNSKTQKPQNRNDNNGAVISLKLNETTQSMNKNNSHSICSIESLDADDGTGSNHTGVWTPRLHQRKA